MRKEEPIVFVIDDNSSIRQALERLIRSVSLKVKTFESAREFLSSGKYEGPSCIVLDVRMPGLSGFDLQEALISSKCDIPIIFLTGHGSIPQSVRAMKAGAVDFIEKPFDDSLLLDAIRKALDKASEARVNEAGIEMIRSRVRSLTPREHQVFTQVIRGRLNKQIAFDLGTVEKTIKVHRARVMQKMQAESVADLVRMAEKAGTGRE